jgi:hypothetical protein
VHLLENPDRELTKRLRKDWPAVFVLNPFTHPEPTGPTALSLIEDGTADVITFGALFLGNPDLPARLATTGDLEAGIWWIGTAMGLIDDIPTCAELISRIVGDAEKLIKERLGEMIAPAEPRRRSRTPQAQPE